MGRHASSASGTPAPYGHACANCSQSKCKCIIRRVGGPCERCHRTNKECRPAETVRRRHPRRPAVSKAARLEEKLDSLVSLIKSGSQSGVTGLSPQVTSTIDDSAPYRTLQTVPVLTPAISNSTASSYNFPSSSFHDMEELSPAKAEEYLLNFRTYKSKYALFIHIPPTTSAEQLRQERPFLWLCIMAVSSKSTAEHQVLGRKIHKTVAQEMVVQFERNIDLLLGLLIFINWGNYQTCNKPFLSVLTHLAMSLVFDLGLNKSIPKDTHALPCMTKCWRPDTPRTMEERRAVLGCFLTTCMISSFLQKMDILRWTPHMDECLQILEDNKECSNDELLVQQIRLQQIVNKMTLDTLSDGALDFREHSQPTSAHLKSLHSQLQGIKTSLLAKPETNKVALLHLYNTELEIAVPQMHLHTNQLGVQQRESFVPSLESIKSWFNIFFTITPADYIGLSFPICSQLFRCLTALYRLSTLDDRTGDKNGVRETPDPLVILDHVINNMEQVANIAGLDNSNIPERDIFSQVAQIFRSLRPSWEAKLGADGSAASTIPASQNTVDFSLPDELGVEFFDNDWLMDLLISPNF